MKLAVPADAAGERLDRFLSTHLGSRAAAERAVESGALVDGVARAKSFRLEGGEEVELAAETPVEAAERPPEPEIVWEDEHLLVVDKPAGLVVHPGAGHALLRVRLETGRMHQIRVHLGAIDLPVVGDRVYGVREPALGRQFLHAAELSFPHPFTGKRIETRSDLPPDLAAYLAGLD
jgi:23S rRNA-/tRNA-specific pseudouridylate synthase